MGWLPLVKSSTGNPTLSFIGTNQWTLQSGGTQTIASVPIGTASTNRRVIIAVLESASYGSGITDISIGGTSVGATLQKTTNNASYNGSIVFGYADVPTGTTANVVITGGGTLGDESSDVFYIYTVDKTTLTAGSPTYVGNAISSAAPTTSNTVSATVSAGGFIITCLVLPGLGTGTGPSITSSTETYTSDGSTSSSQSMSMCSSKTTGSAAGTSNVTFGWTNASGSVAAIYAWK